MPVDDAEELGVPVGVGLCVSVWLPVEDELRVCDWLVLRSWVDVLVGVYACDGVLLRERDAVNDWDAVRLTVRVGVCVFEAVTLEVELGAQAVLSACTNSPR